MECLHAGKAASYINLLEGIYANAVAQEVERLCVESCNGCQVDHLSQRQHDCLVMNENERWQMYGLQAIERVNAKRMVWSEFVEAMRVLKLRVDRDVLEHLQQFLIFLIFIFLSSLSLSSLSLSSYLYLLIFIFLILIFIFLILIFLLIFLIFIFLIVIFFILSFIFLILIFIFLIFIFLILIFIFFILILIFIFLSSLSLSFLSYLPYPYLYLPYFPYPYLYLN